MTLRLIICASALLTACAQAPPTPAPAQVLTTAQVLEQSTPSDWQAPHPESTLYLEMKAGRIIIELAPDFAPNHVANIRTLVRERYFDGLKIIRVQENYVVQWGDPDGSRAIINGKSKLPGEYFRSASIGGAGGEVPFTPVPDGDVYAPQAGYSNGFPVGRDPERNTMWLAHCYGMVGAGRGMESDSGSGAELYVVIGHAPRHLDRNVTLVGRVLEGMELLTSLPRGTGSLGFYDNPKQHVPINTIRIAADVEESQRSRIERMRTDTDTFVKYIESRRFRTEEWFLDPTGRIELCNVPLVVREQPEAR